MTGSVKYDGLESDRNNPRTLTLRKRGDRPCRPGLRRRKHDGRRRGGGAGGLSCGAVHHPRLRLVLIPRHADRFEKVAAWLDQKGESVLRRSG